MNEKETIIKIDHLSKKYRLGVLGRGTLKADLQSRIAKIRGLEDPNSTIGQVNNNFGEKGDYIYALNDVSLEIKKGERLGIIGKNGAGKSTLLKLISRITAPSEGSISYNGKVTSMLEVGTGFNGELTGRENIYLNGAIVGMTKEEIDAKFDDIVEFSEVGKFIDTPVKRYSSGMYVRLAFAVSAHLNADILIMDEVLAVGDVVFQKKCIERMREIAENENKTILYVSHNMSTVHDLCDRCIVLENGQLVYDGDVSQAEQVYRGKLSGGSAMEYDDDSMRINPHTSLSEAVFVSASYPVGEQRIDENGMLPIDFSWEIKEPCKQLHLRVEVKNTHGRTLATKIFHDLEHEEIGKIYSQRFNLDMRMFARGIYETWYVLMRSGKYGDGLNLDQVRGLDIVINEAYNEEEFAWHNDWWGVQIPD